MAVREASAKRLYWVDALKGLVVAGIAVFHASLVFGTSHWVVNNATSSIALMAFSGFTFQWGIALMFLLAGGAAWFAMKAKAPAAFARSRIIRLGVPLLLGVALLSPLQWYVENTRDIALRPLLTSYLTYWSHVQLRWNPASAYGLLYHLWFLSHLLLITLATLPAAIWLRSPSGRRFVARLVPIVSRRGGVMLFAIPLAVTQIALHPGFPGYQDWADLAGWAVVYLSGFVIISEPGLREAFRRQGSIALACGLAVLGVMGIAYLVAIQTNFDMRLTYNAVGVGNEVLRSLQTWSWVSFFLYVGMTLLDHAGHIASWGAEMAMPFYVLHHPVLAVLARYVVATGWSVPVKFAMIVVPGIAITMLLCEGVSRSPLLCAVFGLKGRNSRRSALRMMPA